MSNGVLPAFLVFLKVRELGGDVVIDFAQGSPLLLAVLDRHGDEGDIAEWRFTVGDGGVGSIFAVSVVTGSNGDRSADCSDGGRGGCGGCRRRCGGITIGGTVKDAYRRHALIVQVRVRRVASASGGSRVYGDHRVWTVHMGVMMMMVVTHGDMMRRTQTATQTTSGDDLEIL